MSGLEPKSEASKPEPRYIDRDLYCLQCGYNLRGLSGDPARCPECGYANPIADVEIPADLITEQLKKMEPGAAVFAALLFVALGALSIVVLRLEAAASVVYCLSIATALALASWLNLALVVFPKSCLRKPGWFGALMTYHLWALLLVIGVVGLPIFALALSPTLFRGLNLHRTDVQIAIVAGGAIALALYVVGLVVCVPWAYRRATGAMAPLQREVAITIARTEIRKRLARGPRKWTLPG